MLLFLGQAVGCANNERRCPIVTTRNKKYWRHCFPCRFSKLFCFVFLKHVSIKTYFSFSPVSKTLPWPQLCRFQKTSKIRIKTSAFWLEKVPSLKAQRQVVPLKIGCLEGWGYPSQTGDAASGRQEDEGIDSTLEEPKNHPPWNIWPGNFGRITTKKHPNEPDSSGANQKSITIKLQHVFFHCSFVIRSPQIPTILHEVQGHHGHPVRKLQKKSQRNQENRFQWMRNRCLPCGRFFWNRLKKSYHFKIQKAEFILATWAVTKILLILRI